MKYIELLRQTVARLLRREAKWNAMQLSVIVYRHSCLYVQVVSSINITGVDYNKEQNNTYNHFHVAVCEKTSGTPENTHTHI